MAQDLADSGSLMRCRREQGCTAQGSSDRCKKRAQNEKKKGKKHIGRRHQDLPDEEEGERAEDEHDEMQPPLLGAVTLELLLLGGLAHRETILGLGDLVLGAAHFVDFWSGGFCMKREERARWLE